MQRCKSGEYIDILVTAIHNVLTLLNLGLAGDGEQLELRRVCLTEHSQREANPESTIPGE